MMPAWVAEALKHLGQKEIPGAQHNSWIVSLWRAIKRGGIKDDETPWCAAFVGAMLEAAGIESTRFEGAQSYASYGTRLAWPQPGCIAVLKRPGGWHVGFVVGWAAGSEMGARRVALLGGNQSNQVSVIGVAVADVVEWRWPPGQQLPTEQLTQWAGVAGVAGSMA